MFEYTTESISYGIDIGAGLSFTSFNFDETSGEIFDRYTFEGPSSITSVGMLGYNASHIETPLYTGLSIGPAVGLLPVSGNIQQANTTLRGGGTLDILRPSGTIRHIKSGKTIFNR